MNLEWWYGMKKVELFIACKNITIWDPFYWLRLTQTSVGLSNYVCVSTYGIWLPIHVLTPKAVLLNRYQS